MARTSIRDDHDTTLFVVAGAGTDKTTALVSRIIALVAAGRTDLSDLAAITFTEAAAGELRDRTRAALERAANGFDAQVSSPEAQARCNAARATIDEAALTTLHGFAQRVVAVAPLDVGVPPRFEVLDAISAAVNFDQAWVTLLDDLFERPELREPFSQAFVLGLRLGNWRDIASALHVQWDRLENAARSVGSISPTLAPITFAPIVAACDHALGYQSHCSDPGDKLLTSLVALQPVRDTLSTLEAHANEFDALDLLESPRSFTLPRHAGLGRKGAWDLPKEAVVDAISAAKSALLNFYTERANALFDIITPHLSAWVLDQAALRARAGTLEFHDLLVLARDLLRSNPTVRATIAQRFRYLLIDEFQDTDPLQIELAMLIAGTDAAATDAWHDIDVEPGRVFFVGDPKQSIYRFRRADLALYHQAEARFADGALELRENFRSVPGIIDWVNTTFAGMLGEGEYGMQATPIPLVAHRAPIGGVGAPVTTFGAESEERAADVRSFEANDIVSIINDIVDHWSVTDADGSQRLAHRNDIALLLPTRTSLDAIDSALDAASIPARIESRSLVFSTPEVRDMLSILEAIDDPSDAIAVVGALRSPGFACSDRDLAAWAIAGGNWDYRAVGPTSVPPESVVSAGCRQLRTFHKERWYRGVSDTIAAVIDELNLAAIAVAHHRPRDRWRRMQLLLEHAQAWDDAGAPRGLHGFAAWVAQQRDDGASAIEVPVPEVDDDAVRILTIHGAKGLEFPIVILAGLGGTPPTRIESVLFTPTGPTFSAGTSNERVFSNGYNEQRAHEARHQLAERARLMYVAATRARDHLIVSRHHARRANQSHAAALEEYIERNAAPTFVPAAQAITPQDPATVGPTAGPTAGPTVAVPVEQRPTDLERINEWSVQRGELLRHAAAPSSISATEIAARAGPDLAVFSSDTANPTPPELSDAPWLRGRAATAIGRAVHAVMQYCEVGGDGGDLGALARAQSELERVAAFATEIEALARSLHQSPIVYSAAQQRSWRELPIAAVIGGHRVEGYIDLVIETEDKNLIVVDYKTDRTATDAELNQAVARYTPQIASYALALESVTKRTVVDAVFVFARSDGAIERYVSDLRATIAHVRELLPTLFEYR